MKPLSICLLFVIVPISAPAIRAQNVVTDWNTIASTSIFVNGARGGDAAILFAYSSIAVYDAVNSIHRRFRPFYFAGRMDGDASDEAAAASAAHSILIQYFPALKADLDTRFQDSLRKIAAPEHAKRTGIEIGKAAAEALIAARNGDGLDADVPYTPGTAPGDWQPTPPGFLPPFGLWLGKMRPFTMKSASQFLPRGPYPLSSEQWAADYNVTRLFGEATGSIRTPGQTEIGLFWTEQPQEQYARAWNYFVQTYKLNVMDSARLLAILWTGTADALIGCFNAKYTFSFWRPITAIQAGGGNAELQADPGWTSLATTPNHPEYPAAHGCATAAVSTLVEDFFGTQKVHVIVDSLAFADGVHTHTFNNTADWLDEVFWARIYAGFHFHHSLQDGVELGRRVSRQLFENNFQSTRGREDRDGDVSH